MPASGWSVLCAVDWFNGLDYGLSPSFAAQTVVFLYLFQQCERKEMAAMTMPKREVNSIWSKVREDRDIDDLIFNYDACHTGEDDASSDR